VAAPRKTTEEKLDDLDGVPGEKDRAAAGARLAAALGDKHFSVVAKAAKLAASGLHYDLCAPLAAAYRRLTDKPVKNDPNCIAKKAVLRALVELDFADVAFYEACLRYKQMEPVWGGTVDTAAEIRSAAAMGLVASGHSRALVAVVPLLHDPEPDGRLGAVRAIACANPREAELLLRAKIIGGDAEPAVVGECFEALLDLEPDESLAFVAGYLTHADNALREVAAIALGGSRLDGALTHLTATWDDPLLAPELRNALLRAAALHRSEAAFDWLISLAAGGGKRVAAEVVEVLALYRQNAKLAARLEAAVAQRGDAVLERQFRERWPRSD
jgi:hypothetical protein